MSRTKEIVTAVGTLACALGIGFVMQSSEAASQRYGTSTGTAPVATKPTVPSRPQAQSATTPEQRQDAVIDVKEITLTSALPAFVQSIRPPALATPQPATPPIEVADTSCDILAAAKPAQAAMVSLVLAAPCHASSRVTVHHNGMFFTDKTLDDGSLSLTVPSLATNAVFIFAFEDGEGAVAQTEVPDLNAFNRVVVQWRGTAGFELHAREFGAEYGTTGHVWRNADNLSMEPLLDGSGGYVHSLGNIDVSEPRVAEVYSFPADMSGRNGQINLSVEAEVTARNCGLEIEAQTLELDTDGRLRTQNLTLAVPGCDAIGDFLVLNNVLEDMKVAAR